MPMQPLSHALSRRTFLKTSIFAAGGALLAACAPAAAPAGGSQSSGQPAATQVQLRLSAWADVQDAVVYENMVNAWQERQDQYTVAVEQYPGGYYEKIQANFAAGDPADALYYQGWVWQAYAENQVIIPLDDYIQRDNASAYFPPAKITRTQPDGKAPPI